MSLISATIDIAALSAHSGDNARLRHFQLLTRDQQAQAIRRLAATGMTDHDISHATRLSVEMVRIILSPCAQPQRSER